MVSFKALEEISTTSHIVLRFFSLPKDTGGLTFVSSKVSNKISTSHTVLRYFSLAKDTGGLTFVSFKVLEEISTTSHTSIFLYVNNLGVSYLSTVKRSQQLYKVCIKSRTWKSLNKGGKIINLDLKAILREALCRNKDNVTFYRTMFMYLGTSFVIGNSNLPDALIKTDLQKM